MHEGHRQRMMERVETCGLESLQPWEILEVLLFYTIPRVNTNDIAHRLIDKFGTLDRVLHAEKEDLMSVEGIGERSAAFLRMLPSVFGAYEMSRQLRLKTISSMKEACEYGTALYRGKNVEVLYAVLLDPGFKIIKMFEVDRGVATSVPVNIRLLYKECINSNAAAVILYHNHASGIAVPSTADIQVCSFLEENLTSVGVVLIDMFIVSGNQCRPILHRIKACNRMIPSQSGISQQKLLNFFLT